MVAVSKEPFSTMDIAWYPSWRVIPTKYPPIKFFEDLDLDPQDWEALMEIEAMTDDSIRLSKNNIHLIPEEDRISGPGAGRIMPCFTILDGASNRFSNQEFGAYYAGKNFDTAVLETVYHREKFLDATAEKPQDLDNWVLNADIKAEMHDIRGLRTTHPELYDQVDYSRSQAFAKELREQKSWGIIYDSVRNIGGECVAALRPPAVTNCREVDVVVYRWDGNRITGHYKKSDYKPLS
jgi:hypothetical protein